MVQLFRMFCLLWVLVLSVPSASGVALLGPNNEPYQDPSIGYNPNAGLDPANTGPKNIGEEYRRNTPVLYYSFDQNFIDYFGSNGIAAIEAAFEVFNGLTNVSTYNDLSQLPIEALRVNYQAQALFLLDLKSSTMTLLMEQLGVAEPERYVWALHSRWQVGNDPCPAGMNYTVIKRNFDPVFSNVDQLQPSSYVNGTLYSYSVVEFCQPLAALAPFVADAVEFNVDPLATTFSAVASGFGSAPFLLGGTAFTVLSGLGDGIYYTGLTRDDVGALRYLLRANNLNIEAAGADTVAFVTNNAPQLLFTSNLNQLISAALTNNAGALIALFPGLEIISTTPIFTNVVTTNVFPVFINYPGDPFGTVRVSTQTVVTTNVTTLFSHQFGNVYLTPTIQLAGNLSVSNGVGHVTGSNLVQILTTNISLNACPPGSPYTGLPCTNVTVTTILTNGVFGDYFLLPTNLCSVALISTQLIQQLSVTNTVIATNAPGTTNAFNDEFSLSTIDSFNQYVYVINPVTCPQNTVALRQGVERIRFVRRDYDSLVGQFFYPTNSDYVLNAITNNTIVTQNIRRQIDFPDILITAADLAGGPGDDNFSAVARAIQFDEANALPNLAGPGTVTTPTAFTFNKVGPTYLNSFPSMSEATGIPVLIWGSFDGSTNAPVVYPNGTSILNMENQILIQVGPAGPALDDGTVGVNYTNVFTVNGGTPPYQWTLAPTSPGLPPGLSLNPSTGVISGVPTTSNIYDFVIRMTDAVSRFVERPYSIGINP